MSATYFPEVTGPIPYEGPDSRDPLSFRFYDRKRRVRGKSMENHLKFAVAYWHTFRGRGQDPFGTDAAQKRPWENGSDEIEIAKDTLDAAFEFFTKLGVRYYCFHDRDLAPEGASIAETNRTLKLLTRLAKERQEATGVELLWGTANLFSHPRYTHGAATNPDPKVFAHAGSQVRRAIDATHQLGGSGYVFWGGREGYSSLLNTQLSQEREQLAKFFELAVDYAKASRFRGSFFLEPKAKEPSTHQYDFDCAHSLNFLREYGLFDHFALNVEANHATLATHTFEHELQTASDANKLGSIDINRGLEGVGWDTDNFPTDLRSAVLALGIVQDQGGLPRGGLNFDAKVRRGSFDTRDLFVAHICGMDTWARALLIVERMRKDGALAKLRKARYAAWRRGMGKKILAGELALQELEGYADRTGEPPLISGREEEYEQVLNDYLYATVIE